MHGASPYARRGPGVHLPGVIFDPVSLTDGMQILYQLCDSLYRLKSAYANYMPTNRGTVQNLRRLKVPCKLHTNCIGIQGQNRSVKLW